MSGDDHREGAEYVPGDWIAISGPRTWLLLDVGVDHPLVRTCSELVERAADLDEVLGTILSGSLRALASLAIADERDDALRVVVRGRGQVQLSFADGRHERVDAGGVTTWLEQLIVGDPVELCLCSSERSSPGVRLPLWRGVALADEIAVPMGVGREPAGREPEGPEPRTEVEPPPTIETQASAEPVPVEPSAHDSAPMPSPSDPLPNFDHLFGDTHRPLPTVPDTVAEQDPSAADALSEPSPQPTQEPGTHEPADGNTLLPVDTAFSRPDLNSDVIDALPWLRTTDFVAMPFVAPTTPSTPSTPSTPTTPSTPASHVPAPSSQSEVLDVITTTVKRSQLLAAADVLPSGPVVLAVGCEAGHLSPAHADRCRVCDRTLSAQQPFSAARPTLGHLALSTGDTVVLDRGVVMGRAPEAPPTSTPERPHVVKLASPGSDISRTHVEVRLDGWHVLVVDLGSTNGTVVTLPGRHPQLLRAHDPLAIEPGTVVSLADEMSFTFEVKG